MAFQRRGYGAKTGYNSGVQKRIKSSVWKKPDPRKNRNNLYSLAKQVSRISRTVRERAVVARYNYSGVIPVTGLYTSVMLTDPTAYSAIFGNASAFSNKKRWESLKFNIDLQVKADTEKNIVDYTLFLVSLKPGPANTVLRECGENLSSGTNITGMVSGTHFETLDGHAFMNGNMFNFHWVRRLSTFVKQTIAGQTVLITNLGDSQKRYYRKQPWNRRIAIGVEPSEFVNIPASGIPDAAKLWVVLFNNNNNMDGEFPELNMNVIWTLKTL